jgi:hypothetical protein
MRLRLGVEDLGRFRFESLPAGWVMAFPVFSSNVTFSSLPLIRSCARAPPLHYSDDHRGQAPAFHEQRWKLKLVRASAVRLAVAKSAPEWLSLEEDHEPITAQLRTHEEFARCKSASTARQLW